MLGVTALEWPAVWDMDVVAAHSQHNLCIQPHTVSCVAAVEGLMYLAPACFFWLMLGVAAVEWPAMRDNQALQLIADKPFTYLAAAAMGFCVNLLAYMVIQTASSLTLKVRSKLLAGII